VLEFYLNLYERPELQNRQVATSHP
jgi:hypothetical protein